MGAELSHAGGRVEVQTEGKQADISKLVAAFLQFCERAWKQEELWKHNQCGGTFIDHREV